MTALVLTSTPALHSDHVQYLSQWLEKNTADPKSWLNASQIQQLWETILGEEETQFVHLASTADQAWRLAQHWQINIHSQEFSASEDTAAWQTWAKKFESKLKNNHWLNTELAIRQLIHELQSNKPLPFLPQHIYLLGFITPTPLQKKLFEGLAHRGVNIYFFDGQMSQAKTFVFETEDDQAEIQHMIKWAIQHASKGRVGCVVPQLSTRCHTISQIISRYETNTVHWQFLNERYLTDYALIADGLAMLQLLAGEISFSHWSRILLSPYCFGFQKEQAVRALLEKQCRTMMTTTITLEALFYYLNKNTTCPLLCEQFKEFYRHRLAIKHRQSAKQWVIYFQRQLQALGWPGDRTLNTEEFQLLVYWQTLLEDFAKLSTITSSFTLSDAIQKLQRMAEKTVFSRKSVSTNPIHIIDINDAQGLSFDFLWVMGLHNHAWPIKTPSNPFIPHSLQRQHGIPQASAEQTWQLYQKITQQLAHAAQEVIFSYPRQQGDQLLQPSGLIHHYPRLSKSVIEKQTILTLSEKLLGQFALENCVDQQGPALTLSLMHSQGSQVLKDQAACPFRAFMRFRLGAETLDLPQLGFRAIQRGNLVHQVLEKIWRQLGTWTALMQLSETALVEFINKTIDEVVQQFIKIYPAIHLPLFITLEKQRLQKLILQWLTYEKQRRPFVVIATEQSLTFSLGNLPLRMRVDRIDQLADGRYLIIDYKTSPCSLNAWHGDRLDEPQLPLYYVASALSINAIAFAQLRHGDLRFKGYSDSEIVHPDIETNKDFSALKQAWEKQLHQLAQDYLQGHAKVSPKLAPYTCQYCGLSPLCRIKSVTSLASTNVASP